MAKAVSYAVKVIFHTESSIKAKILFLDCLHLKR